ncbi:unnamed protein product [Microthlaspi erraticum]|uniref:Retrotransposon gag domain-containing protein n=1 Tax=Microthlaspi erraticum TaxID=1685480 RepID=A0A6D2HRZ7_9BRAS|nr:unnamed protein product [Microthlaspi erraticum]
MTKTVTEAKILIENLASSDSDNFIGHERAVKAINSDPYRDGYSEIKAMMAEILRNQGREVERQREAYRVESTIIQDYFGDLIPSFQEEVNFVGIDGLARGEEAWKGEHDVFTTKNHPMKEGCSWRKKLSATPHKRRMEPRSNFEDLITFIKSSHKEHTALIDERLESAFTRLNEKLDSISSFTRDLDLRVANIASSIKREEGMLPGKVEINPRRAAVAAITLRNGKGYEPPAYPDQEEASRQSRRNQWRTQEEVEKPPEEPRVYEPKIPYRNVLSQPKKEKEQAKLKDLVSQLSVRLPFIDACQIIPSLRKYMKAILTSNVSLEEGAMMITKECSAILQNRMPEKLNDPGSFVLSCKIGSTHFHRALCDLGSSVNLMPYSVAKLLGITDFKPTKISLVFADRSVRRPVGVIWMFQSWLEIATSLLIL